MYLLSMFSTVSLSLLVLLLSTLGTDGQGKICKVTASRRMIGLFDVYCNCMETLQQEVTNINVLTIDQSGCENLAALDISWRSLEVETKPREVRFVGAEIILVDDPDETWDSTLQRIEFDQCIFDTIPAKSFAGLSLLTELWFINNYIGMINSSAISNLPNLQTLAFSYCDIVDISSFAISGLEKLHELSFVQSNINVMRQHSIHNLRLITLPTSTDCPKIDIRSNRRRDDAVMSGVSSRRLQSIENLPIPEIGARFLVYRSNITTIETSAIESDMFAFLMFGESHVSNLSEKAFNLELSNQCEITALIMISNRFDNIEPRALAYVKGRQQASHSTYFDIANNSFEYVAENGFLVHPTVTLHKADGNKFVCKCLLFNWTIQIDSMDTLPRHQQLAKTLYDLGQCADRDSDVTSFISTCTDADITTSFPDHPVTHVVVTSGEPPNPPTMSYTTTPEPSDTSPPASSTSMITYSALLAILSVLLTVSNHN